MNIRTLALGMVTAAVLAAPAGAQIWKRGDVVTRSDERILTRSGQRTVNGANCVNVQIDRLGSRRTETVCDWDRDGVYGDADDRRIEADRRRQGQGVYNGNAGGRTRGQARAAEVHARNEARKREREYDKRQRELLKERQKREREALERRQKGRRPGGHDDDHRW